MYDKNNFIVPINNDITLKIRNKQNKITHIIKDGYCTISQSGNVLIIKQKAESKKISLDFSSPSNAGDAHRLLRIALKTLELNVKNQLSDLNHLHNQTTLSNVWNINHNLNRYTSVIVYDINNIVIEGEIEHVDTNNIIIRFNNNIMGKAFIN